MTFIAGLAVAAINGGALAYLAWSGPEWVGLAALLPLLWISARNRWQVAAGIGAYYLMGSRCLPDSTAVFFPSMHSYYYGLVMWLAAGAMCAIPWVVLWKPCTSTAPIKAVFRLLLALTAITLPPVAIVGWLNPWMGASSILPGMGWWSVIAGLVIMIALTAAFCADKRLIATALVFLILLGQIAIPKSQPELVGWKAVDTTWGRFPPSGSQEEFDRLERISKKAVEIFSEGYLVVLFPEQIAGNWKDASEKTLRRKLQPWLEKGHIVVLGAEIYENGSFGNAVIAIEGTRNNRIYARQTVPASMWRPGLNSHYPANWLRDGSMDIAGKKIAVLMCYEDFIFGIGMLSFIGERPKALLSVANAWWWRGNSNLIDTQRLHASTLAKIFGVPLLRPTNLPPNT